jgi:hypothetical protein
MKGEVGPGEIVAMYPGVVYNSSEQEMCWLQIGPENMVAPPNRHTFSTGDWNINGKEHPKHVSVSRNPFAVGEIVNHPNGGVPPK